MEAVIESSNSKLLRNLQNYQHCLHPLLPQVKRQNHKLSLLRPKALIYQGPDSQLIIRQSYDNFKTAFCIRHVRLLFVIWKVSWATHQ